MIFFLGVCVVQKILSYYIIFSTWSMHSLFGTILFCIFSVLSDLGLCYMHAYGIPFLLDLYMFEKGV